MLRFVPPLVWTVIAIGIVTAVRWYGPRIVQQMRERGWFR
jgi:hypothetical protein